MKFRRPFSMIRKISLSLFIILLVYLIMNYPGNHRLIQRMIPQPGSQPGTESVQPMGTRVDTIHLLCRHKDSAVYKYGNGRFIKEVITPQNPHPDYTVKQHGRMLIYRIRKKDWCSSCENHQFITISLQRVVVKYGTPDKPGPVRETLQINPNRLPNSERDDLLRGIPFRDDKDKLQIIEGLSELNGKP